MSVVLLILCKIKQKQERKASRLAQSYPILKPNTIKQIPVT